MICFNYFYHVESVKKIIKSVRELFQEMNNCSFLLFCTLYFSIFRIFFSYDAIRTTQNGYPVYG